MAFRLTRGREAAQRLGDQRAALKAQLLRTKAVNNCPVDTGRLRQSIGVQKIAPGHYRVGTNVNDAPYVEFGTRFRAGTGFFRAAAEAVRHQQ